MASSSTGESDSKSQASRSTWFNCFNRAWLFSRRITKRLLRALTIPFNCASSLGITSGYKFASKLVGTTRRGPIINPLWPPKRTSLSPPRPIELTLTASTIGCQSPIVAPSLQSSGCPLLTIAISVVVPPISAIIAFFKPLNSQAPITLAAGPDSTVPIGFSIALARLASEPSPFTIISGAVT